MSEIESREKAPTIHAFEQQGAAWGLSFPRSCATPQHGKPPDLEEPELMEKLNESRSFQPRPGH